MSPEIHWQQIALRLAFTLVAGSLIGMERSRSGHFAGLRTTLLVMLAASISMIEANLLMETSGKTPGSFVTMDVMRLPLGILTGVGFIGAGAIVRKGDLVVGLTTAATLWFSTIVGLCLGSGQLILGSTAALLGFFVLWGLRRVEQRVEHFQMAVLSLTVAGDGIEPHDLRTRLERARFRISSLSLAHDAAEHRSTFQCELRWPTHGGAHEIPAVIAELESLPGLKHIEWRSISSVPS